MYPFVRSKLLCLFMVGLLEENRNQAGEQPDLSEPEAETEMKWYNYIACFFAGVFLTNGIPHFIHGIDGDAFPTPFATPAGTGLSSPLVNIMWALGNFAVGYLLTRAGKFSVNHKWTVALMFLGVAVLSMAFAILAPSVLANYKAAR